MTASSARSPGQPLVASVALAAAVMLAALSAGFFYAFEASFTLGLAQVDDAAYVAQDGQLVAEHDDLEVLGTA